MLRKPSHLRADDGAWFRGPGIIAAYPHLDLTTRTPSIDGKVYGEAKRKT
jgi:hypothetical protein